MYTFNPFADLMQFWSKPKENFYFFPLIDTFYHVFHNFTAWHPFSQAKCRFSQ